MGWVWRTMISKVRVLERCGEKDTPLSVLSTFFNSEGW